MVAYTHQDPRPQGAVKEWNVKEILKAAAFELRALYEKKHGCNMGFDTGCSTHTKDCPHWPKVYEVWEAAKWK